MMQHIVFECFLIEEGVLLLGGERGLGRGGGSRTWGSYFCVVLRHPSYFPDATAPSHQHHLEAPQRGPNPAVVNLSHDLIPISTSVSKFLHILSTSVCVILEVSPRAPSWGWRRHTVSWKPLGALMVVPPTSQPPFNSTLQLVITLYYDGVT